MEALKVEDLKVMQVVIGDAYIFDCWVVHTESDGKVVAVRPKLLAWVDIKSRRILGDVICEHSDSDVRMQSILKLLYLDAGSVPQTIYNNNSKVYTEEFYKSVGIENSNMDMKSWLFLRSYVERFFGSVCGRFMKSFGEDICKKTDKVELFTMEEFKEKWNQWLHDVYEVEEDEVLKKRGEKFTTPKSCFENADRYFKECPPRNDSIILRM